MRKLVFYIFPLLIILLSANAMVYFNSVFESLLNQDYGVTNSSCSNGTSSGSEIRCDDAGVYYTDTGTNTNYFYFTNALPFNMSTGDSNISINYELINCSSVNNGAYNLWTANAIGDSSTIKTIVSPTGGGNLFLQNPPDSSNLCDISLPKLANSVINVSWEYYTNFSIIGKSNSSGAMAWKCQNNRFYATNVPQDNKTFFGSPDTPNQNTGAVNACGFRNFRVSNLSFVPSTPDTTPPEINANSYNMTSEGGAGCTNWRTNKSNPCPTSDTTPTLNFTTNKNAWCAIGTQNINFSDYDALAVNRNCTSGQGTTSHTCTLVSEDELVYDNSFIYIACEDANKNQNLTSTSGALALSITELEAAARDSIGIGIQNTLLNDYTNYTDLQIIARNLAGTQVKGTFDKAVKKGTKMWAFNRIGVSDSHVNMFNVTPVLYTLELSNKTSSQITLQVEQLINATK